MTSRKVNYSILVSYVGKGQSGLYDVPTKEESEWPRGEGENIKFTELRFERRHFLGCKAFLTDDRFKDGNSASGKMQRNDKCDQSYTRVSYLQGKTLKVFEEKFSNLSYDERNVTKIKSIVRVWNGISWHIFLFHLHSLRSLQRKLSYL